MEKISGLEKNKWIHIKDIDISNFIVHKPRQFKIISLKYENYYRDSDFFQKVLDQAIIYINFFFRQQTNFNKIVDVKENLNECIVTLFSTIIMNYTSCVEKHSSNMNIYILSKRVYNTFYPDKSLKSIFSENIDDRNEIIKEIIYREYHIKMKTLSVNKKTNIFHTELRSKIDISIQDIMKQISDMNFDKMIFIRNIEKLLICQFLILSFVM